MSMNATLTPRGGVHSVLHWNGRHGSLTPLGSPGVRKMHAGKYEESTSSRQRGGGGFTATPLPT